MEPVREDLEKKMAFLGGSRQVGKTILAEFPASEYPSHIYLNWDNPQHKLRIIRQQWPPDTRSNNEKICVTGSARLDISRRGGDSLPGRYHYFTLHPFGLKKQCTFAGTITVSRSCPVTTA